MRVNVSQTVISKTFMNGLKVSPEPKLQQQQQQRQLSKSNNFTWEFFINFKIQQQQQFVALKEFAIFAISSQQQQQQLYHFLIIIINLIISFNGFNRLTVLMNELRLKTFYCQNSKINKSNNRSLSNIKTTKTWSSLKSFNKKQLLSLLSSSTTPTTSSSSSGLTFHLTNAAAAASAVAFATSAQILLVNNPQQQQQQQQQTFHNNNNNNNRNRNYRTYNNSKKSNKIFLYYTPRDPRLRILLKTKHFFSNRPQQQQQSALIKNNTNCCCVKNFLLSDLCNYGELIGGLSGESSVFPNNQTFIQKSINFFNLICYSINCNWEICDKNASDNFVIIINLATAGAAIVTISAALNLLVVLSEFARELLKTIEILLLSFHYNHQKLKIFNVKSTFGLHDSIL